MTVGKNVATLGTLVVMNETNLPDINISEWLNCKY